MLDVRCRSGIDRLGACIFQPPQEKPSSTVIEKSRDGRKRHPRVASCSRKPDLIAQLSSDAD